MFEKIYEYLLSILCGTVIIRLSCLCHHLHQPGLPQPFSPALVTIGLREGGSSGAISLSRTWDCSSKNHCLKWNPFVLILHGFWLALDVKIYAFFFKDYNGNLWFNMLVFICDCVIGTIKNVDAFDWGQWFRGRVGISQIVLVEVVIQSNICYCNLLILLLMFLDFLQSLCQSEDGKII